MEDLIERGREARTTTDRSYHSPRLDQIPKYQAIRSAAKHFAEIIITNTRDCGDRDRAITLLRQSVHMANAAVAMDGRF